MNVRLTHIDGKLPNLALMKLSHWHKAQGDSVTFTRSLTRDVFEPEYDRVYGSTIFAFSRERVATLRSQFPEAIVHGTGVDTKDDSARVEDVIGVLGWGYEHYDYSLYPAFASSIGFSQRGCRLKCGHCCVPWKEGKPVAVNRIVDVWRGEPYPRQLHLLDNDFFGQPEAAWKANLSDVIEGGFRICFNQGINVRLITEEAAERMAQVPYYDDQFKSRRLYTAWDNLKDEKIFFRAVDRLERAGVPPTHLMVYMLIGFDPSETMERIMYRFERMVERGIRPYPMVYNNADPTLKRFQRWVIRRYYTVVPFEAYDVNARGSSEDDEQLHLTEGAA